MDMKNSKLAELVRLHGEKDGDIYRVWLGNLNGVCNLDGHTDIMCAHLGEDGVLTFQVNTPDDSSTVFVYLEELPQMAIQMVVDQLLDVFFPEGDVLA